MSRAHARPPRGLSGWALVAVALAWLTLLVLLPLFTVFGEAFAKGVGRFLQTFDDPDATAAIRLTLLVSGVCVVLNAALGLAAAWVIGKFEFRGKGLLMTLIDLPLSVSPVISGMVWVLLFGAEGWFAPVLKPLGLHIIFNVSGLILATLLVTLPYVARELIPLMQEQGQDEEIAAITLGASGWTTFLTVTLPNVRWALLSGVLLCNARAMGEFGAVSVVSGHIRGLTETMPLHVEALYNEYDFVGAFSMASVLAGLALVTLVAKSALEWRTGGELAASRRH
jgi:sulfate/thiosulfate transport system permease protein